jgi:hypothetical protein
MFFGVLPAFGWVDLVSTPLDCTLSIRRPAAHALLAGVGLVVSTPLPGAAGYIRRGCQSSSGREPEQFVYTLEDRPFARV